MKSGCKECIKKPGVQATHADGRRARATKEAERCKAG